MSYFKRSIPDGFAVLSGALPPDDLCFHSQSLQILCNNADTPWKDDGLHAHQDSDEAYLVLQGSILIEVEGETVRISANEICFVPRGSFHAVTDVIVPYRGFVLRAPSVQDKIHP